MAPGGGFRTLSMQNEGWDGAQVLAARGIAAFVLEYRLNQTPASREAFDKSMKAMFSCAAAPRSRTDSSTESRVAHLAPQIADARAAFALVRALDGQGGQGFGMYPKATTSTGWFDAFYKWIVMNGFTKPAA